MFVVLTIIHILKCMRTITHAIRTRSFFDLAFNGEKRLGTEANTNTDLIASPLISLAVVDCRLFFYADEYSWPAALRVRSRSLLHRGHSWRGVQSEGRWDGPHCLRWQDCQADQHAVKQCRTEVSRGVVSRGVVDCSICGLSTHFCMFYLRYGIFICNSNWSHSLSVCVHSFSMFWCLCANVKFKLYIISSRSIKHSVLFIHWLCDSFPCPQFPNVSPGVGMCLGPRPHPPPLLWPTEWRGKGFWHS